MAVVKLPTQAPITSEATALGALVAWSADCPVWQRDALRRLCTTATLADTDTAELLAICKGKLAGKPLDVTHVKTTSVGNPVVTLRHVRDVENVNALAPDETLTFTRVGLTVVYGDNGSGKSGYARILKQSAAPASEIKTRISFRTSTRPIRECPQRSSTLR
jgi:hypothetical protein